MHGSQLLRQELDRIVTSLKAFVESGIALIFPSATTPPSADFIEYPGMCDPSAAVAITDTLFIVASDEDNVLRVYKRGTSDAPQRFDLNSFLRPDDHPEADIEGGARIGDRIFWIASHGRNAQGKLRPSRHRLFATRITRRGQPRDGSPRRSAIHKDAGGPGTGSRTSEIRS